MSLQIDFFGGNCIRIKSKHVSIVFDDNLKALGGNSIASSTDVVCITNKDLLGAPDQSKIQFFLPGEYEVGDAMITGIQARPHADGPGNRSSTIYKVVVEDMRLIVLGHIAPDLSDEQLEAMGVADVLFIPVGGHGYTFDAVSAVGLVKKILPKTVIPTHYQQPGIKFEVPQDNKDGFVGSLAIPAENEEQPLKIKKSDLGDGLTLKVLEDRT